MLEDLLDLIYDDTEIVLYEDSKRVGKFIKEDIGIQKYLKNNVEQLEPNDNKSIVITVNI